MGAYARWQRLGDFLGRHMVVIIPTFLMIGVSFPEHLGRLRPIIPTLFAIMTFQNSLANRMADLRETMRSPGPIGLTLLVMHVIFPLLAFTVGGLVFGFGSETVAGIVLEYTVPIGASTVMWVSMASGDIALTLASVLFSSLVAPFSIPMALKLLVGATVQVDSLRLMGDIAYMVALPAILAIGLNEFTRGRTAETLKPALAPLSKILLPIIVATNATSIAHELRHLTPELLLITCFVGVCTVAGFVVGVCAGRLTRQPYQRLVSVGFACGIRNISVGAHLAATYFTPAVVFPAVIGTLFQQTLAALFGKWVPRLASMGTQNE
jgi:predicted Na+-dependent transporter